MKPSSLAAAMILLPALALASEPAAPAAAPRAEAKAPVHLLPGSSLPEGAAEVPLQGIDGKKATLAGAKGEKGTLVFFTCNHCPFVKAWQDRMVALGNAAAGQGFGVIAVNSNDPAIVPGDSLDAMKELAASKGYRFPYAWDEGGRLAKMMGATRTPEVFLLDASGKVAYHGAIDDNSESADGVKERWLRDALDALAGGKEIAVKDTKAIGCSIKFPKA